MALMRFGPWSLVGMSLATELGSFIFTGSLSPWRPSWPSRQSGVRPLLAFGAHQTAASLLFSMARNCDALLIGRFYGAAALGLYSRGGALVIRPLEQFLVPINSVFLPTLSRLQSQPARYRSTFLRLYEAIAMVTLFFTSLLLPLSYPLTLVALGPKWERASVIFGGFTLLAIQIPLANVANSLYQPGTRQRYFLSNSHCVGPYGRVVCRRLTFWSGRRSHGIFHFRTSAATSDPLLQCWPKRSGKYKRLMD